MARSGFPRNGPESFWFLFGIAVLAALLWQFWYIAVGVGVLVLALRFLAPRRPETEQEGNERRLRVIEGRDAIVRQRGEDYLPLLAAAVDALSVEKVATVARLQERFGISRQVAETLHFDLMSLGLSTTTTAPHLREAAALIRALPNTSGVGE